MNLALDELKNDDDIVNESHGIKIVYNLNVEQYVQNAVVDYLDKWYTKGFTLTGAHSSSC